MRDKPNVLVSIVQLRGLVGHACLCSVRPALYRPPAQGLSHAFTGPASAQGSGPNAMADHLDREEKSGASEHPRNKVRRMARYVLRVSGGYFFATW